MSAITPEFCDLFRKEFSEIVKPLEEKHSVKIKLGNITYDPGINFTAKITVTGADGDKKIFEKYCNLFGLKDSDYGRIVNLKGDDYKIVGLELKRSKFPIVVENVKTKKKVSTTEEAIKSKLK